MTTITRENFTAAMKQAVAERGEDYTYPNEWRDKSEGCLYTVESPLGSREAACLIGRAIEIVTGELVDEEWEDALANKVLERGYGVTDAVLLTAARDAQLEQDNGYTWGHALEVYLRTIDGNEEGQA